MGTEKYPKYFKTAAQMRAGKLGPMKVDNGIVEVLNEEQEAILRGLPSFQAGGMIQVGLGKSVEVLDNGSFKQISVPNRFANVFTDEEMININKIPDDVFEETVLFNIREIAKEYSDEGKSEEPEQENFTTERTEDTEGISGKSATADAKNAEQEQEVVETVDSFKTKADLQARMEELGILYPKKANKEKLFEIYTQHKNGPPEDEPV